MVLENGTVVGRLEEVSLVEEQDTLWTNTSEVPRLCRVDSTQATSDGQVRREELQRQLYVGNNCAEEERMSLIECLLSLNHIFALTDEELGETGLVEHVIDTGQAKPTQTIPRRLLYSLRAELEEELRKLLQTKCIEPSNSPYVSGLVPVRKKDGNLKICVDYRAFNRDTVADRYPIPRIDELIDAVGNCKGKWFTSLDLMKGYHQVQMAEDSKCKTAFTCHLGLFHYRRMLFGLTNAPATFQ